MLILTNNVKIKENDETTLEIEVINTDKKDGTEANTSVLIDNNCEIKKLLLDNVWIINKDGYAYTRIGTESIYMHQLIFEHCFGCDFVPRKKDKKVIDHLNNNSYDNRLRNLHILMIKDNSNKKLIDLNFDNLTVYVEYNYKQDIFYERSIEEEKEIYNRRKYVLSYVAPDMFFYTNKEEKNCFNCFELVYDDYYKFIEDAKEISFKTKKINSICKKDKNKKIEDMQFELKELQQLRNIIENILNTKNWAELRNRNCNILTKEQFSELPENEKQFLLNINKTVLQYLPPNDGGSFKL